MVFRWYLGPSMFYLRRIIAISSLACRASVRSTHALHVLAGKQIRVRLRLDAIVASGPPPQVHPQVQLRFWGGGNSEKNAVKFLDRGGWVRKCVCLYMHACIRVCIYVFMRVCISHLHIHVGVFVCLNACKSICVHKLSPVCTRVSFM